MQIMNYRKGEIDNAILRVCNFILKGKAGRLTLLLRTKAICYEYNERSGKTHPTTQRHLQEDRWNQNIDLS
jgi:hypothetical protein